MKTQFKQRILKLKYLIDEKCQSHHQLQDRLDVVGLLKRFLKVARALTGRRPVRPAADDDFDTKIAVINKILFSVTLRNKMLLLESMINLCLIT